MRLYWLRIDPNPKAAILVRKAETHTYTEKAI